MNSSSTAKTTLTQTDIRVYEVDMNATNPDSKSPRKTPSTLVSPPPHTKRQKLSSTSSKKFDSTSASSKKCDPVVVDLSKDDINLPFFAIKNKNPLFFSYDPRGNHKYSDIGEENLCCRDCNCPIIYCADKVFGQVAAKRAMTIMRKDDIQNYDDEDSVGTEFVSVYTSLLTSKMIFNNISFDGYDPDAPIRLPGCILRGSLRRLCEAVETEKERDADDAWNWAALDLSKSDEEFDIDPAGQEKCAAYKAAKAARRKKAKG